MNQVAAITPCCGRRVRPIEVGQAAVFDYHRTCPKCHQRWHIVAQLFLRFQEGRIDQLSWGKVSR